MLIKVLILKPQNILFIIIPSFFLLAQDKDCLKHVEFIHVKIAILVLSLLVVVQTKKAEKRNPILSVKVSGVLRYGK